MTAVKEQILSLVNDLPDSITWEDALYEIYVKEKISLGMKQADEGDIISFEDVRKKLLAK